MKYLAAILLIIAAACGAWWYLWPHVDTQSPATLYTPAAAQTREAPAGYAEYRSEFYKLSLLYPTSTTITQHAGAYSTMTLVFEDTGSGQKFQIYMLPYGEPTISKERFLLDEPSGVMASSTTMDIGGISAGAFYGQDATLGATYEVWLVNKGFLYEAAAPASDKEYMLQVLSSWQFL